MKDKIKLVLEVDDKEVKYHTEVPEILKKYFTNMETTIETLNELTNGGQFSSINAVFNDSGKMVFTFSGRELVIRVFSPMKRETMALKNDFCELRNKVYHSFIKRKNIKYILKTKPKKIYEHHYKFYDSEKLVLDISFGYDTINMKEFINYLNEEKLLLNRNFSASKIKVYEEITPSHLIEYRDLHDGTFKVSGLKEILNEENFDNILLDEDLENIKNNLDEIDEILYKTGLIKLSDIKEALEQSE